MSILEGHLCEPSDNPRHPQTCRKCGKPILDTTTWRRDIDLEREITYEAAKGVVDPEALILFAEARTRTLSGEYVNDPMLVLADRDRLRDAREEVADLRNHLVWWLQSNVDSEKAADAFAALRHTTLIYDLLSEDVE